MARHCYYSHFVLTAALFFLAWIPWTPAKAITPKYQKHSYLFETTADYYTSTANYSAQGGEFESLGPGREFSFIDVGFSSMYGWTDSTAVFGALNAAYAESKNTTFNRSNSELTEAKAGLRYKLWSRPFYLIPELFVVQPLNSFSEDTDEIITGNGVFAAQAGAWLEKYVFRMHNYAYLGFRHQAGGLAGLMYWKVGTYKLGETWIFGGELNGYSTAVDDEEKAQASVRDAVTARVNAGSKYYYSANPEINQLKLWTAYRLDPATSIKFAYEFSFNGANAADGSHIYLGFRYRYDVSPHERTDNFLGSEDDDLNRFNVISDKHDPELFKNPQPKPKKRKKRRIRKEHHIW